MADSSPFTKSQFTFSELSLPNRQKPIRRGRSFPNFLFKSILFALCIIVIPLFPSQAPEFINQTIFTKFWELFHLLFIGIAVAYGLFSRRNVGSDTETHPSVDNTPQYVSNIFPVSTTFGDGYEKPCGSYEKTMMHCWNSQYFEGESGVVPSNGAAVRNGQYRPQLPISGGGFRDSFGYDGAKMVQAWNSDYYHSEPVVVVAQPYCTTDECGEIVSYKPLGLPVRSLRSTAAELDGPRYANESDSSSSSKGSSTSANKEFGDLGSSKLEQQFNNAAGLSSPIPWHPTFRRVESEEMHGNVTLPSHFMPFSVDEATFASLSSRSLQSTTSFSSQMSLYSSLDSVISENRNFQEENMGKEKSFCGSSLENMNFQEKDMGKKETAYGYFSENMNLPEEDIGENEISHGYSPEILEFKEELMGRNKSSHGYSAELNFHGGGFGKKKISRQSLPRSVRIANKDMGEKDTSYVYSSENMNLQEEDMGGNEISHEYSPEDMNCREEVMGKEKSFYGSSSEKNFHDGDLGKKNNSSWYLPRSGWTASKEDMGNKETSYRYSSENMNLQEEDMGEIEISYGYSPGNMNFREEGMGKNKSSYGSPSEMNFHEGDLGKKKTSPQCLPRPGRIASKEDMGNKGSSYGYSSENINLQVEDMGGNEISYGYSPENMNSRDEVMGKTKGSNVSPSEMNFYKGDVGRKKTSLYSLPRSGRIASKEKSGTVNRPTHFRPRSVDDMQTESLNSWSCQDTAATLSSGVSLDSSVDSVSSENRNLQKEELGEKKSSHDSSLTSSPPARMNGETTLQAFHSRGFSMGSLLQHDMRRHLNDDNRRNLKEEFGKKKSSHGSSSSSSPSPPARMNGETSVKALHSRGYSIGSSKHDIKTNLKDDLRGLNGMIRNEDSLRSKESGMDPLQSDPEKPATLTRAPSKGKSVRTRRTSVLTSETTRKGEICNKQTDEKMEKVSDKEGAVLMRKDKTKNGESDHPLKGLSATNLDTPSPKLETTFSSYQKRENHEPSKDTKEDLDIDLENIQLSSDDDAMSEFVHDSGLDSEVDKKASEFIAKFKAQIRLQKMASVERSKGPRTAGNYSN